VHDELVLEVKEDIAEDVAELVKKEMEAVAELRVPVVVDVGIGKRWGGIK
jgi:DNA polymerase-1